MTFSIKCKVHDSYFSANLLQRDLTLEPTDNSCVFEVRLHGLDHKMCGFAHEQVRRDINPRWCDPRLVLDKS